MARIRTIKPDFWKHEDLSALPEITHMLAAALLNHADDEGFFKTGDAARWVDESRPEAGIAFAGRLSEEFKLASGTWVRATTLRTQLIDALQPYVRDLVIAAPDRPWLGALVWLDATACAEAGGETVWRPALARLLAAFNDRPGGSSTRIRRLLEEAEDLTRDNDGLILVVAFNYGARDEIARAVRRIADEVANGTLKPDAVTAELIGQRLDALDLTDPDLIIRTSGETRVSNFLLLQGAYAEFVFSPIFWPDFTKADLVAACTEFARRERRYGLTSEQLQPVRAAAATK